jgi:hypothetical protein
MIFYYLLIIIIIVTLVLPHNKKESFVISTFKKNVLAKTEDFSKYIILHQ